MSELNKAVLRQPGVFTVSFDIDTLQCGLFVFGLMVRAFCLHYPSAVVFDEQVLGTFASYYLRRTFYLDSSPPLSAQLMAFPAYLAGHDGSFFNYTRIGADYPPGVPFLAMRLVSCLIGSALVPVIHQLLVELAVDRRLAALCTVVIATEPALVLQSRLVMPEGIVTTLCFVAVLCVLRARRLAAAGRPTVLMGVHWLVLSGLFAGLAVSTRFVGFFTILLVAIVLFTDYWTSVGDLSLTVRHLVCRLVLVVVCAVVIPLLVYVSVWWLHLTLLTRALPRATYRLSSPFVASLEGGITVITEGQPKEVAHGSVLTLRHGRGVPCWLHSHRDVYPLTYADGRGSSYQQQVTCYPFKDRNNWWIVTLPGDEDDAPMHVSTPPRLIRHGDIVQLVHGATLRKLNSHNVAAPVSVDHQEVSCYIDYNVSMPPHTDWKVDIINRVTDDDVWKALFSEVRLIHVDSSQALSISGLALPEWGSHQYEVVTEKYHEVPATAWSVEEHKYLSDPTASGDVTRQIGRAELLPARSTLYGFWAKLAEVHVKLFGEVATSRSGSPAGHDHRFCSTPSTWPLGLTNIVYWAHNSTGAQIHFVANPIVWWPSAMAVLAMLVAQVLLVAKRQAERGQQRTPAGLPWNELSFRCLLLVGGYGLHYVPFFLTDDVLFLYCYLPSLVYAVVTLVVGVDSITRLFPGTQKWLLVGTTSWAAAAVAANVRLSPLVYGFSELTPEEWRFYEATLGWDYIDRR